MWRWCGGASCGSWEHFLGKNTGKTRLLVVLDSPEVGGSGRLYDHVGDRDEGGLFDQQILRCFGSLLCFL